MNIEIMSIITLCLSFIGMTLVSLGAWLSVLDERKRCIGKTNIRKDSLDESVAALTKLVIALKDYPTGQRLIVFGILILFIAGAFGGIAGLSSECSP